MPRFMTTIITSAGRGLKALSGCGCLLVLWFGIALLPITIGAVCFHDEMQSESMRMLVGDVWKWIIVWYLAVSVVRFAMRFAPIRADRTVRWGCVACAVAILGWECRSPTLTPEFVGIVATAGLFITRQLTDHRRLNSRYTLFLRRFDGFSDLSLLSVILRGSPRNQPVVVLVGTGRYSGSWDPLLLGFSGLSILHPLRSAPIFLASDDWELSVRLLIRNASSIVVDVSHRSPPIDRELSFVVMEKRADACVLLVKKALQTGALSALDVELQACPVVTYVESWSGGIARAATAVFLGSSLVVVAVLSDGAVREQFMRDVRTYGSVHAPAYLLTQFTLLAGLTAALFLRKMPPRHCAARLRHCMSGGAGGRDTSMDSTP